MPSAPRAGKLARECKDLRGVVASGTGEDRDLSLSEFDVDLDDTKMFFARERGALAGCTAGNEEVDACSICLGTKRRRAGSSREPSGRNG